MVEDPQAKREENFPLLKVEGGGDGKTPSAMISPAWSVASPGKRSFLHRLPEYFSTCWMTFILLGISFMIFYALGLSVYKKQRFILIKCNDTKPASNVYYHHIVPSNSEVSFSTYTEYLSHMSYSYPSLQFNLFFLIDDTQSALYITRHTRFMNKFVPYIPKTSNFERNNKALLKEFQDLHRNVNITVNTLSKYMAATPMRYKWRSIPLSYLTFYARIYSVWQNGGLAIDLTTFNNQFNNHFMDRRIAAILKEHNDGIKPDNYFNTLRSIDRENEAEFFTAIFGFIGQMINETRSFWNSTMFSTAKSNIVEQPKSTNRSKRDVKSAAYEDLFNNNTEVDINLMNSTTDNNVRGYNSYSTNSQDVPVTNATKLPNLSSTANNTFGKNLTQAKLNNTNFPQVMLFYDFSILTDDFGMGPSNNVLSELNDKYFKKPPKTLDAFHFEKKNNMVPHILSIDWEGTFVAATSRLHPLLGYLIGNGCQRTHPKFAIENALLNQCSGFLRNDVYCDNIYLL